VKFTRPTIVLITAPTCSGKTHLLEHLIKEGLFARVVGTTTRPRRQGEVDGETYQFVSKDEFSYMADHGKFTQTVTFSGNSYGVTTAALDKAAETGLAPAIIVEPTGIGQYRQFAYSSGMWDVFQIYVSTEQKVCLQRLNQRTLADLDKALNAVERTKLMEVHTTRTKSILQDEAGWQAKSTWNVIAPGDDIEGAVLMIKAGIYQQNRRVLDGTLV
jgi:guanylate kinase